MSNATNRISRPHSGGRPPEGADAVSHAESQAVLFSTGRSTSSRRQPDSFDDRSLLNDSLHMLGEQLRRSYLESTRALVAAVEARDPYTHDHSQRVSQYAKTIAIRMNLSDREINRIETAAILHDIGKIGVPDSILQKTERLLPEEFDVVRCHPAIGVKILGHTTYLRRELPIILHHHERYDGRGYPEGLAGENIPIGARILATADALDAMLSRRAYRDALPMQDVRREFRSHSGTQFDPAVVDALLDWLDEEGGEMVAEMHGKSSELTNV